MLLCATAPIVAANTAAHRLFEQIASRGQFSKFGSRFRGERYATSKALVEHSANAARIVEN
jgi:hypothetical protein